ncbi:MAG: hypothetical protein E2582_16175 [Delftia sp.]|nr:hypothetical protein [Delftia sp.]
MEHNQNAAAANAHAAAASARQAATSARLAELDAKYARSGDLARFLREVGAAGLTLADLADWLAAAGAKGIPKFAVGGMLSKDFVLGQVHPGEAIVPATFNPWPEALALGREIVRLNERIARLLNRWDGDGVPEARSQ